MTQPAWRVAWVALSLALLAAAAGLDEAAAVAIELDVAGRIAQRVGDAVGSREQPVEIVEAAVFRIDDDDVLYAVESRSARLRC